MTERVQCAECSDHYNSEEHPFCPRCGAVATAATPTQAAALAGRNDPRRRRVQAAGVMMLTTGAVTLMLFLATAIMAGDLVPQTLETFSEQPGGDLDLTVTNDGVPLMTDVHVLALNGTLLRAGQTDANGSVTFDALESAGVQLFLPDHNWSHRVLALQGLEQAVEADVSEPSEPEAWLGADGFVTGSRVLAAVFAVICAVTVAAGIAAIRFRQRNIASTGAILGGLPWLILFVASMNILVLFVLLFYVLAFVFLRQGRTLFTS